MMDTWSTIKIHCPVPSKNNPTHLSIEECIDFTYLYDSQSVIVPVVFKNWQWGLVYQNLSYMDSESNKSRKSHIKSCLNLDILGFLANSQSISNNCYFLLKNNIHTYQCQTEDSEEDERVNCEQSQFRSKKMKEFLKKITILPCKQPHLFYLLYPGKI